MKNIEIKYLILITFVLSFQLNVLLKIIHKYTEFLKSLADYNGSTIYYVHRLPIFKGPIDLLHSLHSNNLPWVVR